MSENKHTPEPWAYGEDNDGWYVEKDVIQIAHGLTEEDARRIVAGVNACAGIDTELLEIIEDNDKTLAGVIANVEKQRDELLAAFQRFMDSHEECTDFDGFAAQIVSMDDYHQAQEAIASVKEKK